jgi:hypothetical protein
MQAIYQKLNSKQAGGGPQIYRIPAARSLSIVNRLYTVASSAPAAQTIR